MYSPEAMRAPRRFVIPWRLLIVLGIMIALAIAAALYMDIHIGTVQHVADASGFHWERFPNWDGGYVTCLVSDTSGRVLYCQ